MEQDQKVYPELEIDVEGKRILYDIFVNHHNNSHRYYSISHSHSYYEIVLIQAGEFQFIGENKDVYTLYAGDTVIITPYTVHNFSLLENKKVSSLVVKFTSQFLYPMIATSSDFQVLFQTNFFKKPYILVRNSDPLSPSLFSLIDAISIEKAQRKKGYEVALRGLILQLYILLVRNFSVDIKQDLTVIEQDSSNPFRMTTFQKAMDYIEENYMNDISLQEVADYCGVSYGYLSKSFKKIMQINFSDYLLNLRLSEAKTKLLIPNTSITKVAMDCGFNYVAYFIQKFRMKNGITPKEYQKQFGENSLLQ